jgi:hypothetical protein
MKNPRSWRIVGMKHQAVHDFPEKAGLVYEVIETICPEKNRLVYVLTEIDS